MSPRTLSWGQSPRGSVEYSEEDDCWHGRLLGIRHIITYESDSERGLYQAYKGAVCAYYDAITELNLED